VLKTFAWACTIPQSVRDKVTDKKLKTYVYSIAKTSELINTANIVTSTIQKSF